MQQECVNELEVQFYRCVVRNAACVLGALKPAALFSFVPGSAPNAALQDLPACATKEDLHAAVAALAHAFNGRFGAAGLRCDLLFVTVGRALLLVSRPRELDRLLGVPACRAFLDQAGYATDDLGHILATLRRRIRTYERTHGARGRCTGNCATCTFPHEVGVLLGYPLEDVRGFVEHGGRDATAVGPWKSYGDPAQARAHWDRLASCKRAIIRNYANGTPFEALIA